MSTFKTFQPLLFDSFKYVLPNSSYMDDYNKTKRKHKLERNYSLNSNQYKNLSQNEKMTILMKHKKPFSITRVVDKQNDENKINHVYFSPYVSVKEVSDLNETKKNSKSSLKKSPSPVQYDNWVKVASDKEKEAVLQALNQNETSKPKLLSPPPTQSNTTTDILIVESNSTNSVPDLTNPTQTNSKTERTNISSDTSHWIVFKQDETPNYILEAKKRLGQIKQPQIAPTSQPKHKESEEASKTKETEPENRKSITIKKHWLQWDSPGTPDYIQAIRQRLRDDRYKKVDLSKKYLEINRSKSDIDSVPNETNNKVKLTRSKSSVAGMTKSILKDTNHEVHQISQHNIAQTVGTAGGGYFSEQFNNSDEQNFYNILPAEEKLLSEADNHHQTPHRISSSHSDRIGSGFSFYNNEKPPRSGSKISLDNRNQYFINDNSPSSIPIQQWMQNAEEKDREDVLKVLKSLDQARPVSRQSTEQMIKNFVKIKSQNSNTPNCTSYRKSPAPQIRKLGSTRQLYKLPSEKNEKNFIRENLWIPNNSATANVYGYNI